MPVVTVNHEPTAAGPGEGRINHKKRRGRVIGRTKGGLNTKLYAVADAEGRPIRCFLTDEQISDYTGSQFLLNRLPDAERLLGDKVYDTDCFREALRDRGIQPCIPRSEFP